MVLGTKLLSDLSAGKFGGVIELWGYYFILLVSCFMWSAALDSSGVLLSYSIVSLASPITNILISTSFKHNKHIYLSVCSAAHPAGGSISRGPR